MIRLERELARARGEPYAVPCDFPVKWDIGAPMPALLRSDGRTYLVFYVSDSDAFGHEASLPVPDSDEPGAKLLALVTFQGCVSAKLGHPNDEVPHGHPLAERGLESYTAQIVMNSPWLAEVARTNSVHYRDDPERWRELNHYVFWFHDDTFECLAVGYEVEIVRRRMGDLLAEVAGRMPG